MEVKSINESIFLEVMGNTPINRILNFLDFNDYYDFSLTDIAREARVGYATIQLFWKKLELHDIVRQTRRVGKAKMYKLNKENPVVRNFQNMIHEICKQETEKMFSKAHVRHVMK